MTDPHWRELALCAQSDPEVFFPDDGYWGNDAKRICHNCDVQQDCLNYAITNYEDEGIWGGLSGWERVKLRRQRRKSA